ncbi:MAG: hypothetical protein LQ338_002833 [Usnochroma carphineum]|nr:MAG: hypothetical protein LQ338_002833 [Usnochroma carphineum]
MPRDTRTVNPASAHLKSQKAQAIRRSKLAVSAQRNERLAQRNPSLLERQIADLQSLAQSSPTGGLNAREKKQLEELERQLSQVRRAREKVGVKDEDGKGKGGGAGRGSGAGRGVLGKRGRGDEGRRRWGEEETSSGSETDESVRRIPMPRDTPPPIPPRYRHGGGRGDHDRSGKRNANLEPLGEGRERQVHALPTKPEARTTYEAKPVVRDLRKEAVKAFMPAVVARKVGAVKGEPGVGQRL